MSQRVLIKLKKMPLAKLLTLPPRYVEELRKQYPKLGCTK